MAFFDKKVFNPNARRYAEQKLSNAYKTNQKEKKRFYKDQVT